MGLQTDILLFVGSGVRAESSRRQSVDRGTCDEWNLRHTHRGPPRTVDGGYTQTRSSTLGRRDPRPGISSINLRKR